MLWKEGPRTGTKESEDTQKHFIRWQGSQKIRIFRDSPRRKHAYAKRQMGLLRSEIVHGHFYKVDITGGKPLTVFATEKFNEGAVLPDYNGRRGRRACRAASYSDDARGREGGNS